MSTSVASSLMGHTEKVNEDYYTYDTSNKADTENQINMAQAELYI